MEHIAHISQTAKQNIELNDLEEQQVIQTIRNIDLKPEVNTIKSLMANKDYQHLITLERKLNEYKLDTNKQNYYSADIISLITETAEYYAKTMDVARGFHQVYWNFTDREKQEIFSLLDSIETKYKSNYNIMQTINRKRK